MTLRVLHCAESHLLVARRSRKLRAAILDLKQEVRMADSNSGSRPSITQLILVPAIITLVITILRVVGELQHWSPTLFSSAAGGGGALVGIAWLPFIFGPYFAIKLAGVGAGPDGTGKSIGIAVLGFVVVFCGGFVGFAPLVTFPGHIIVGMALAIGGAALQFMGWPGLAKALLAYGYAARIPVAILMFFALRGSWGTHYDALPPNYTGPADLWGKYFFTALLPQLIIWPVYTIIVGSLFGSIANAIARRSKPAMQTAA
jgi:hypothetical protein